MCAASPARRTRPTRYRSASRVASLKRESERGEWTPKSVPAYARSCVRNSARVGGHRAILGHGGRGHDGAVQAVSGGADAESLVGLAHLVRHLCQLLRGRGHLHLAEEPLGGGGLAGETDAEQSAHQAASAVAADQPAGAQPCAVGELDAHPVPVLLDTRHLAAAADLCAELGGALSQQAIGDRLGDAKDVAVCGVQIRRRGFIDSGEAANAAGILLPVCEEPVQQPALVHDLNAARVQAKRADRPARLRVLLQHEHVHAVQPQLAGQHHPRRPAATNDHVEHVKPRSKNSPSGLRLRIAD